MKIKDLILFVPRLLAALVSAWSNMSSVEKRQFQHSMWWLIILVFGPLSMLWNSCEHRPVAKKRKALIEVNCKGASSMTNKEVEETYQYGLEEGWFKNK